MYDVFKVVNWLRVRNYADMQTNPNVEELTQMKAMKLLYYLQAATLSITGHRLFDNDLVAWKYGPVVVAVHDKYAGHREIVGELTDQDRVDYALLQADQPTADILNSIYDVYGHSSAYDLMQQTHQEKPWQITRRNQVISDQVIKDFYSAVFVADEN